MFSLSQAETTRAMRPGLVSGRYPERDETQSAWIDRAFSALQGRLAWLSINRRGGLHKVAAAIGRQGKELTVQDTAQLNHMCIELRRRFRSRGLSRALCIRSFALIREVAERAIGLRHYDSQLMVS